jgi:hypothetical protein
MKLTSQMPSSPFLIPSLRPASTVEVLIFLRCMQNSVWRVRCRAPCDLRIEMTGGRRGQQIDQLGERFGSRSAASGRGMGTRRQSAVVPVHQMHPAPHEKQRPRRQACEILACAAAVGSPLRRRREELQQYNIKPLPSVTGLT